MPQQWHAHFHSLSPAEAPWSSVEVWSVSTRTCCYAFADEWRKLSVPERDPGKLTRRLRADFDVLWIGGGGMLGFPHPPWTHNRHDWQGRLLGMPTVWAAVGASGLSNWTRTVVALGANVSTTLWRPRDPRSLSFLKSQHGAAAGDFAILWDPVLADNHTYPAILDNYNPTATLDNQKPTASRDIVKAGAVRALTGDGSVGVEARWRVCWVPRVTPLDDGLLWMRAQFDPLRDMAIIFEEKDNYLANFFPDLRLHTNDAPTMWRTFRHCGIVISMRYHGCILALRAMRPTVAMVPADELSVPLSKFTELMAAVDQLDCMHAAVSITWADVLRCVERFRPQSLWNRLASIQLEFRTTLIETLRTLATFPPHRRIP
jgi:hypothetical protein